MLRFQLTIQKKFFYVDYSWKFDWASTRMRNYFDYNINGVDHNITLDELLQSSGVASSPYYGSNNKISWNTFINPFKPVISVVTKEQIESAIRKVIFVNAEFTEEMILLLTFLGQ